MTAGATRQRQPGKLRVGMYWASSCGGCDISLLEIAEHLLELIEVADIVFWPCVADFKYRDVAGYPDGHIDVCLFNGAIRSSEQEESRACSGGRAGRSSPTAPARWTAASRRSPT